MATITFFDAGTDPNNALSNLPSGVDLVNQTGPDSFEVGELQLTTLTLYGTGFTYDPGTGLPTGGILTGFVLKQAGKPVVTVEGLSGLTLPDAETHRSGAPGALLAYLLSGNDVTTGGPGTQIILAQGGNDILDGGEGADYVAAGDGDDEVISLLGQGPSGLGPDGKAAETLIGGAGTDRLKIDRSDWALSFVFDLMADGLTTMPDGTGLSGFEQMEFRSGSGSDTLAGAALADIILGGAGDDRIRGRGDNDSLSGGDGADSIAGDSGDDTIGGDTGIDTLDGGSGNDVIDGGDQADRLFGGEGQDILIGGLGADNIEGGLGNDLYFVDNRDDVLFDAPGEGYDVVVASSGYVLSAAAEIELLMTADPAAKSAIGLTGNGFNNTIRGNAGANPINGRGGSDTLIGGRGRDTFVFDAELSKGVYDRVIDFRVKDDSIRLSRSVFEEVPGRKVIDKDAFWIGKKAADAEDRIIYNPSTGGLFYDEDGTGLSKAILVAKLTKNLKLTELDFLV